jgi:hypothetical protein
MIDIIAEFNRIKSKTNLETFNRYSDSLEAISEGIITYMGYTDSAGDASGLTIVDTPLAGFPNYSGQIVKILDGGAAGQTRNIKTHIGNTMLVDQAFTDVTGAAQQIAANIAYVIISRISGMSGGDIDFMTGFPSINEVWEPANIDLNIWTPTHPATNNIVVVENTAPNVGYSVVEFNIEDAEAGRLIGRASVNRWRAVPTLMGTNHLVKKLVLEFEGYFNDLANVDDTNLIMGWVVNPGDTLASNNIIGFGVDVAGGTLDTVTDLGGGRVTIGLGWPVLEDTRNKFRIEIDQNNVYFFVNEVFGAVHPAGTLPDQLMYPCWYMPSAGGGGDTFEFYLGAVRIGYIQ